jgi:succinate dehydrogenase / fumarate reductase membrane anchor subunit
MAGDHSNLWIDGFRYSAALSQWWMIRREGGFDMSSRTAPRVGFSFEYLMWIFTRISGLALVLLAAIGIVIALIMGARTQMHVGELVRWTFFPNAWHVVNTDIPDVEPGWFNRYWDTMQMLIVFFGVTHGVNGLRVVLEDYMRSAWLRIFTRGLLFLFWLFMLIVAFNIIWEVTPV